MTVGKQQNRNYILGLNYGGHDTSAALMEKGTIKAACEQERFTLDKHSRKFPLAAINECLKIGNIDINAIDEIAYGFDPDLYIRETYLKPALSDRHRIEFLINDIERIKEGFYLENIIREKTGYKGIIGFYNHHLCHLAATYYSSGFDNALLVSNDGVGEYHTGLIASGRNGDIKVLDQSNVYPHSLGLLYSTITFYLGWKHHCDEGIIMGLAPFGDANATLPESDKTYYQVFEKIIEKVGEYGYRIDTSWVVYHQMRDKWVSDKFIDVFGKKRKYEDPLTQHHKNIAAALQKRIEDICLDILKLARKNTGFNRLALSGGLSLNCSMNGKIEQEKIFDAIYVQPASGDNGVAIGACYLAYKKAYPSIKYKRDHNAYLGSRFLDHDIEKAFLDCKVKFVKSNDIYTFTAEKLAEGKIVGWFQGEAEFGPRALGNRSILAKPYPEEMKDFLNKKVKFREEFRPFAPAILSEYAKEYFEMQQESPHMLIATQVREEMKEKISATVHIDKSCRAQTVSKGNNIRFRKLLEAFYEKTDCPVLLNTSFNVKGQPIVNTPKQAIECVLSTNIDVLVIGDYYFIKQ